MQTSQLNLQPHWTERIGRQREWVWRGWQVRYSYRLSHNPQATPPLLLIHGFGAAIEHWRHNIPILAENHSIYAIDLLGFGGSRKAKTSYTTALWVEQVYDFWQTFIGQPTILFGNSIGSLVCLSVAATHPDMVAGIVMLNLPDLAVRAEAIPRWLQPVVLGVENLVASPLLLRALFPGLRSPKIIRRWAGIAYCDRSAIDEELVEIFAAPARDEGATRTFISLFGALRQPNFAPAVRSILPHIESPMLLVWGRQDRMVPRGVARSFSSLNPRLELVELDRVGHCPHDEAPEAFHQVVLPWLAKQTDTLASV